MGCRASTSGHSVQRGTNGGECTPRELGCQPRVDYELFEQDVATDDADGDDDYWDDDADDDVSILFNFSHMATAESITSNVSPTC